MRFDSEEPIRILLIDDDEDDYLITKRAIDKIPDSPFTLEWCSDYDLAKELISERNHDIYLVDYQLGEHTGLDILKDSEVERRLEPFILLTGANDRHVEKQAMRLGASDYLAKGSFDPELLARTLSYALGRKRSEIMRMQHLIELNQAKDEFISVASHQLRTPATGVKQYIGMLIDGMFGELTEMQKAILLKAYESNERQLKIVTDLLQVARVDAGKVVLKRSEVDLNSLLTDVVREESAITGSKRQKIKLTVSPRPALAFVDKDNIRMVFENLIDNASKYSEEGSTVRVLVSQKYDSVTVKVKDEGIGIGEQDLARLFEKFARIHNTLAVKTDGSGIGLYWAQKIVDLHGGSIEVKSELGRGSTFQVTLPKTL